MYIIRGRDLTAKQTVRPHTLYDLIAGFSHAGKRHFCHYPHYVDKLKDWIRQAFNLENLLILQTFY